ncbi:hypothetical protein BC835DRAFT_1414123 [Cytidiella melzeri]|nr:hypothetical protein BC835DRAFT_1414123 [Cytidiella melzeri]
MSLTLHKTSAKILTEKVFLQGALLSGVAYGTDLSLFMMTVWLPWKRRSGTSLVRRYAYITYLVVSFIIGTLSFASSAQFTQLAFIDNCNIEGGSGVYEETMFSIPVDELRNVWRFYAIFNNLRVPRFVVALPSAPLAGFIRRWPAIPTWTFPFFALSLSLNILLTICIALRLLIFRKHVVSVLGDSHGFQYTSIAAMVVESAAMFSIFSVLFLVPFTLNHPLNEVFFQAPSGVQIVETLLIMFRVAQGKSLDSNTIQQRVSTVRFATMQNVHLSSGTVVSGHGIGVNASTSDGGLTAYVKFEDAGMSSTTSGV